MKLDRLAAAIAETPLGDLQADVERIESPRPHPGGRVGIHAALLAHRDEQAMLMELLLKRLTEPGLYVTPQKATMRQLRRDVQIRSDVQSWKALT